jgi:type II secretory pathway component GspD/PulD (secretin)
MYWLLLVLAQDTRVPVSPPKEAEQQVPVVVLTSDEVELANLIQLCAGFLQVPIEFSRGDVSGTVTLQQPRPTSAQEVLDATHRALAQRGFTTVQMPGSPGLTVVKLADAAAQARLEESSIATKAGFVKVLLRLDHDRTDSIAEAVKLMLSKSGSVTAFKDSRSLLVSDQRANVVQAQRITSKLDSNLDEMAVVEVPARFTSPTALAALIDRIGQAKKAVFGEKGRGTVLAHPEGKALLIVAPAVELDVWRTLIDQFDKAEPATTVNYSPRRFALAETAKLIEQVVRGDAKTDEVTPWRMVNDDLTGTLIVTTTPSRHAQIEQLLNRLEAMAQSSKRPIRSFGIKNRPVEELQGMLQGLLDAGALKGEAKPAAASAPAQGVTAPLPATPMPPIKSDELGDKVILTADKATNRLIALGESRVLEQIEGLIKELDVRQPQVLVEVLVVTMTDSQTTALGVELRKLGVSGEVQYQLSSLFGRGSPDPGFGGLLPPTSNGFTGVVLKPGDFSALVRALETINSGRTLTMPKVLVSNNQPAELNSVLQTPYASTNASTTVATTSFGGSLDAGTQITVTPQIAAADQLVLDYTISLSSFTGVAANPALPPPRQENRLKSIATIPDGFTIAVGGLEIDSEGHMQSSVPLLGRIPILGALFSDRSWSSSKNRFYVFLRCNVMRANSFEDLKYASRTDMAAADVEDGWPKLEPRVMR